MVLLFVCFKETSTMEIWYLVDFKPLYQLFSSLDINLKYYSPLLAILTGRKPCVLFCFSKNPHLSICTLGKNNPIAYFLSKPGHKRFQFQSIIPASYSWGWRAGSFVLKQGRCYWAWLHRKRNLMGEQIIQEQ